MHPVSSGYLHGQESDAWTTPLLKVGATKSGTHPWERVVDAVFLADGRLAVADGGANSVLVLDSLGAVEMRVGRPGQGPGEFQRLMSVATPGGDTLIVEDDGNARLHTFSGGDVLEYLDAGAARRLASSSRLLGVREGRVFLHSSLFPFDYPGWFPGAVVALDPGASEADTVASFDFALGPSDERTLFSPSGVVGDADTGFIVGRTDRRELAIHDARGRRTATVVVDGLEARDRDAVWEEYEQWYMDSGRVAGSRSEKERALRDVQAALPETLPLFGSLRGLPREQVLLGAYSGDPRFVPEYTVVDRSGEVIQTLLMPSRSRIVAMAERRVAILRYDELGVESIEVYRWPLAGG